MSASIPQLSAAVPQSSPILNQDITSQHTPEFRAILAQFREYCSKQENSHLTFKDKKIVELSDDELVEFMLTSNKTILEILLKQESRSIPSAPEKLIKISKYV